MLEGARPAWALVGSGYCKAKFGSWDSRAGKVAAMQEAL